MGPWGLRTIIVVTTSNELSSVTQLHVERAVNSLVEEFGDVHSRETIERVMGDSVSQLAGSAEVDDFLATLAHRFTRERLKAMARAHGAERALPDVLFVGLGDSGRGQIAAALVTLRSEGRVVAHSAGRTAAVQVDPAVVEVMQELTVDLTEAYAKPLSAEVLQAADVVVTMGRSVGSVEIPPGTRHLDWRVGDPTGASVDEARRVREDIDRRVQELLAELDPGEPEDDTSP
jgi:arsenate reductase (thioredoxin)